MRNVGFVLLAPLVFAACGGGDGGGSGSSSTGNDSPGGIWNGAVTFTEDGSTHQAVGLVTETGEMRFVIEDGPQVIGNMAVSGTSYSADITSYAPTGFVFDNGLPVISGSASGAINERSSFSGSSVISGITSSTFSFTYDPIYERGSSLSSIAGVYSDSNGSGYTETYSIDTQGIITGSDTDGCVFSGNIAILNSNYNIYRINITASNCGDINGDYAGLATLTDDGGSQSDTLVISVSGDIYVVFGSIPRT